MTYEEKRRAMLEARKKAPRSPAKGKTWKRGPNITKERFKKALRNTAGVLTRVRDKLGIKNVISIHRALAQPDWADMRALLEEERKNALDVARAAVLDCIEQDDDLKTKSATARWLLERKDEEYKPRKEVKIEGGPSPIQTVSSHVIDLSTLNLPVEVRRELLKALQNSTQSTLEPQSQSPESPKRKIIIRRPK